MLSVLARIMLSVSAIAPVSFTYAWVAYTQGEANIAFAATGFGVIAVAMCLTVLGYAQTNLEVMPFQPASIEAADRESIGFMLLYLLPLFTDKINTLNWSLWLPTIAVFGIITATGYGYHFNPLLGIMGWHFYKVSSADGVTYILITKKHLRTAATTLSVGQLTEYIIIDLGKRK
jgi:hypothetical protein